MCRAIGCSSAPVCIPWLHANLLLTNRLIEVLGWGQRQGYTRVRVRVNVEVGVMYARVMHAPSTIAHKACALLDCVSLPFPA